MLILFNRAVLIVPVYSKIARIKEKWFKQSYYFVMSLSYFLLILALKNRAK